MNKKIKSKLDKSETRHLFKGAADAIFVADTKTRKLVDCNDRALEITGYSKEEICSMKADDLHPKEIRKEAIAIFKKQAHGKSQINKTNLLTKHKEKIPIEISTAVIKIDSKSLLIGIFRDISRRKKIEKEKEDFLNVTIHEIKAPLMNVFGLTDLILNGKFGEIPSEVKDNLKIILKETNKIKELTDKLKLATRLEKNKVSINIEKIRASEYLKNIRPVLSPLLTPKDISLKMENKAGKTTFYADALALERVLKNLVMNSVQHSKSGTKITVSARKNKKNIIFEVKDQGSGIPRKHASELFKKFEQEANLLTRKQEGLGLGLYICRKLIEQMNGTIKCKSKVGKGTTMIFTLPLKKNK